MSIVYRPAREDELAAAEKLVVGSINDLTERHGFGRMAGLRPPQFQIFCLRDDPAGLWVAEDGGRMVGFALSWACGDLWFLAELFVAPDQQGRGIGSELLKRTEDHARACRATTKALITFTFNTVSQGLYVSHGLMPRLPLYIVGGSREALLGRVQRGGLQCRPLRHDSADLQSLDAVDARALGVSRRKHHRYLISGGAAAGMMIQDGDRGVGYFYVNDGHIGPLAVAEADAMGEAFNTALLAASDCGAAQISALLPGGSQALAIAMACGMRIAYPMVLVANRDFGDWTRYLPRNPGFM
jgi:ribosomal protein S18 acetylase RimI-like enzyme